MRKFEQEVCEVCYEPLNPVGDLPPEIQEKVYRPGVDGIIPDVELDFERGESYSSGSWELIEPETEE